MTIQNLMKRARGIINKKDYKIFSKTMVEVKENNKAYLVVYITKPGRTIQTCSCTNAQKHCNQPTRCLHKLVAEWILMLYQINKEEQKCKD